jgi:hypothetical protein
MRLLPSSALRHGRLLRVPYLALPLHSTSEAVVQGGLTIGAMSRYVK